MITNKNEPKDYSILGNNVPLIVLQATFFWIDMEPTMKMVALK